MFRRVSLIATTLAVVAAVSVACAKVPFTGRKQLNLVPNAIMDMIGKSTYAAQLSEAKTIKSGADVELTRQVGKRIATAAARPDYEWRYALIDDKQVNAWCLPGGKIGVYTGILPAFENEAGMAFVIGHEVGHAIAHHGGERVSQQLVLLGGLAGIEAWLSGSTKLTPAQRAAVMGAVGLGAEVGIILPFSRSHETEADVIGLMLMSKSGYPPAESIKLWDRMERETGGAKVPAFLSTHPSSEQRQATIRDWLPQAKKRYERNKLNRDTLARIWN
jgi:predicted Zn-dependent protease